MLSHDETLHVPPSSGITHGSVQMLERPGCLAVRSTGEAAPILYTYLLPLKEYFMLD